MSSTASATLIDGQAVARRVRVEVREAVDTLVAAGASRPGLATVLVGDDPASALYVAMKQRDCREVGISAIDRRLPASARQEEVAGVLDELNEDEKISGILLQLPLPPGLDAAALTARIDPSKDVDGLTPQNAGLLLLGRDGLRPCTPAGIVALLDAYGVELEGSEAVVLGRSNLVGKPLGQLLLARHATVTSCHSHTRHLPDVCARADLLVAAAGRPALVRSDWVKPGATVIDVGTNRGPDGRLVGDVDFPAVAERAGAITPVPGGVGPMTRAMLVRNTLQAAQQRSPSGVVA